MVSRRIALLSLAAALGIELATACGGGSSQPEITSISPQTQAHGTSFTLTVFGRNFLTRYAPDAGDPSASKAVGSWTIELNGVSYPVTGGNGTALTASIPGLPPKLYDVGAVNPEIGAANILTNALFISGPY